MTLHTYLPQDRLRALARGETLPDRTNGTVLFADISGFTALAESLRESLGARQGAEELSKQLGEVYSALIVEVEKYGGSVIDFAGDALLCWFGAEEGGRESGARALASAFGMQTTIQSSSELGLKVAITSGNVRRFVVGNPETQKLDAVAGATVGRASTAEHQAAKWDVLVDEATAKVLEDSFVIKEWREENESKERFAVVSKFIGNVAEVKTEPITSLSNEVLKSWVHYAVFERETSSQGTFLTEFRPCVVLFVRFDGIDYDTEVAEKQLDTFLRQAQNIVERYDGILLQVTIGDKGSYAYINFGALRVHEDDARRAVKTALDLEKAAEGLGFLAPLQIGITQGTLRVGEYGGKTRKTFGALGDDVNLAARLMTTASPGEILLSGHVHKAVINDFTFEPRVPLPMKGKTEPLPVFVVTGERQRRAVRLQEPNYVLPMVGREEELQSIEEKLDLTANARGQVIGIVAEAGLGKSRLVAEVIRSARRRGFVGYGGACQSDGIHTPYLAWKSIWQAFFDVDPEMPSRKLIRWLEEEIKDRAPDRVDAIPLLNVVLDLNIPENDFTQNLEPKIRQSALHALLEDCLKAAAQEEPILIVVEDLHWIDALSHDLLEQLAKALANYAVCFLLAYRPPELLRLQAPRLEALPQFTRLELRELNKAEAESAIRAKLAQLYPARSGAVSTKMVDTLMARAQGNPFYLEELLNYLRDRGLDPREPSALERIELPDSLHTLILSRIDRLSEQEKMTLRVASIVGRLFRAKWLTGYYPELGTFPQVKAALDALASLDITPLDSPEPELTYLFKHIVTHEVTYESLPFATRAKLHEQLARYLENLASGIAPLLDTIAFHYGHSENTEKQCEYLRKAGEAAQAKFANDAALEYYGTLLPLLKDAKEQTEIHLRRGQVLELIGKWDDAEGDYRSALECARGDMRLKASVQSALGNLCSLRGDYELALDWLVQAKNGFTSLGDHSELVMVYTSIGSVLVRKGNLLQARRTLHEGLKLARKEGDPNITIILIKLGLVAFHLGDYSTARAYYEESLALWREEGDKVRIAMMLNNLGILASIQGDYHAVQMFLQESQMLCKEVGDKNGMSISLNNLGYLVFKKGDYPEARMIFEESLALTREMGSKHGIVNNLNNLGSVTLAQNDYAAARGLFEESLAMSQEMGEKSQTAYALLGLGLAGLAEGTPETRQHITASLHLRQEMGEQLPLTSSLVGMAGLALQGDNARRAAKLLGAVSAVLEALNAQIEVDVLHFHTRTLAEVRKVLNEAAFQTAWEQGAMLSLKEAVKYALEENE